MDYDNLENLLNVICDYERIGDNPKIDFKNDTLYISNIHIKSIKANEISLKNIALDFDDVTFSVDLYQLLEKFYEVSKERLNITKEIKFNDCEFVFCDFSKLIINNQWEFKECVFKKSINFYKSIFQKVVIINFTEKIDSINFQECDFYTLPKIVIANEMIDKPSNLNQNFDYKNFNDRNFLNFQFQSEISVKGINFINSNFKNMMRFIDLNLSSIDNIIAFKDVVFEDMVMFGLTTESDTDKRNIERQQINAGFVFRDVIFENSSYFCSVDFHNVFTMNNVKFKSFASFSKSCFLCSEQFNGIEIELVQNRFLNCIFYDQAEFDETIFENKVNFSNISFNKDANFYKTKFSKDAFFRDCKFLENAFFKSAKFQKRSYFNRAIFHGVADFSNAIFAEYANFEKANFKDVVYFDKSEFENFINMANCTINDVMSFYGAKLHYTPYLAGVNIDKNAKFNLMYTNLTNKDNIENIVNKYINSSNFKGDKIDIVKGFRESFRILKSYLISNHNLLEASFYRVNELKAKELEMDLMRDKLSLSESLENLLFKIYKNTSNHHSDLLRILCFTLCMAGLYIVMSYFVTYIANIKISFMISGLLFSLLCFRYVCCKKDYLQLWFWGVLLYAVFGSIVFDVLTMFCFGVFVFMVYVLVFRFNHIAMWFIGALIGFILVMHNPQTTLPLGGIVSQDLKNYHLNKAILNLDEATSMKLVKTIDTTILTELKAKQTLLDNVKVLNDSVFDEYASLKNAKSKDSIMQKINFIYYLMMILCLFSLQKTARKNSIMPN